MYGIYNNRRGRRPLCMVFITTDVPWSLKYSIYNNRRAVVPYVWYL